MMSKQDRQGVRTPADLERKYNLGSIVNFSSYVSVAQQSANKAMEEAEYASTSVVALDSSLDQEELLKRLTEDGLSKAIYIGEDGLLYVDPSYINGSILLTYDNFVIGVAEVNNGLVSLPYDADAIDAQASYTAMATDTLIVGHVTSEKVARWYGNGWWTSDMVNTAIQKGVIDSI